MGVSKQQIKRAIDCGDLDIAAKYLSAGYLIQTIAMDNLEMGIDILAKHGLVNFELKREKNAIAKHFDEFCRFFTKMIDKDNQKLVYEDWSELSTLIDNFLKIK